MQKLILLTLISSLLSLLISCASVPDVPVCVEISPVEGFCTNTLSDKDYLINDTNLYEGETWWEMRPKFVLLPPKSYAKLKAYLIKNCKTNKQCKEDLYSWERQMRTLEKKVEDKGQGPLIQ